MTELATQVPETVTPPPKRSRPRHMPRGWDKVTPEEKDRMLGLYMEEGNFMEVARRFNRTATTVRKFAKEGNWKTIREAQQRELDPKIELDKKGRERRHLEVAKAIQSNVMTRFHSKSLRATPRDALLAIELERKISGDDGGGDAGKSAGPTFIFMKWDFVENVPKPKEIVVETEAVEVLPSEGA